MVDSFCCVAPSVVAEPRTGRSETTEDAAPIDEAEIASTKADDVVAVFEFGQANEFPDNRLADEGEVTPPFDLAPRSHPTDLMVGVVPRVFDPRRHGPRRGRVEIGRRPLP